MPHKRVLDRIEGCIKAFLRVGESSCCAVLSMARNGLPGCKGGCSFDVVDSVPDHGLGDSVHRVRQVQVRCGGNQSTT